MGMWLKAEDVVRRHHLPVPDRQMAWVSQLVDDAEDKLLELIPDLGTRVSAGAVPRERVKRIAAAAVLRVMRNPEGYTQFTRTTGPFTQSGSRPSADAGAEIGFRPDELDSLRPPSQGPARSVQLAIPRWMVP